MALLTASNLGKSFGPDDIFEGISLSIPHRARIALVGPNGVGKTTLLRILMGFEEPSHGIVQRSRGLTVGYLPQEATLDSESTLWEECLVVFSNLLEMKARLHQLEKQMANPEEAEAALHAYGKLQVDFDHHGGYEYELRLRQTLIGLGFLPSDFDRPVRQLSGGQRTRAYLAKLLLTGPDLLMLDEPTNHLDIAAVEWLEKYFSEWDGAVLLVSHDRYFLDQVARVIWEMTPAFEVYHGNYSAYRMQRTERYARRLEEYEKQSEFIAKEEDYIKRNIAGQNTRQAQGRRKRLERLLEDARLAPPKKERRRLHLNLQASQRSGDLVIRTYGLAVGYADEGRPLFHSPDLTLTRGECAAVIGPNGAGKTTFLKTLLGQIPAYSGEVDLGASLQIGYFAQAHEGLHPELDLIGEIQTVASGMLPNQVREYLAKFLFTGDEVFKTVDVLSGGERSRMALAKLALSGANLLLLDEPTNHLDLPSQEVLQGILADFRGTILLVSHDRYLIDALATQIWEVNPQESALTVFEGTYSEYKTIREAGAQSILQADERRKTGFVAQSNRTANRESITLQDRSDGPGLRQIDSEEAKPKGPSKDVLRRQRARLQALEDQIASLEWELASLGRQLENPPTDPGEVQRLGAEYVRVEASLNSLLGEWERQAG